MSKYFIVTLFIVAVAISCNYSRQPSPFISAINGEFILNNQSYTFKGANYWQGMNLGAPLSGDQQRLIRELDQLQNLGVNNLRVLAASEADSAMKYAIHPALQTAPGVYNQDVFEGLDFLLSEMAKRDMKAVMVLGNFWTWSGGFPQYLKWSGAGAIPYPQEEGTSWRDFTEYSKAFFTNDSAKQMMNNHIKTIISRKNTITGKIYKDDPTIMSWQLANEPRGYDMPEEYRRWIAETAYYIKSLDHHHMVCIGSEGNTSTTDSGTNVLLDNDDPDIDYITMHIWMQNWGWYKPGDSDSVYNEAVDKVNHYWDDHVKAAELLNKPMVLEEFGIARDGLSFLPDTTTYYRDKLYGFLMSKVAQSVKKRDVVKGFNFWSYSGEGRPPKPGEFWQKGDAILGDPPHELQGWYGVYNTDSSTLKLIKEVDL